MYKLDLIFLSLLIGIPIMYNFDLVYSALFVTVIVCLFGSIFYLIISDCSKPKVINKSDNKPKPITAAEAVIKADKVTVKSNTVKAPTQYKRRSYNTSNDDNIVVDTIKTVVFYDVISDVFFDD